MEMPPIDVSDINGVWINLTFENIETLIITFLITLRLSQGGNTLSCRIEMQKIENL